MAKIDPTARIEDGARLAADVVVGPFCTVSAEAELCEGVELVSHVCIMGATRVGANTKVYPFAVLGGPPQALRHKGGVSRVEIGAGCIIREGVTINGGGDFSTGLTVVGERCFMMTGAHVGHDCRVGNDVTFANCATLGGHATIGDRVFLGGLCAVHQFTRVGELAIVGGLCAVVHDLIPYGAVVGARAQLGGLNMIGLKRSGLPRPSIHALRHAYRMLFFGEGATVSERVERVAEAFAGDPHVGKLVDFVRTCGKRQLTTPREYDED